MLMSVLQEETGTWMFAEPAKLYAPDVPQASATAAIAALRPMSLNYWLDISPALATNWETSKYKGRMAYIRCTQDAVIAIQDQDLMLKKSRGEWIVRSIAAGHSPFLSCPAELANIVVSLAEQFAG